MAGLLGCCQWSIGLHRRPFPNAAMQLGTTCVMCLALRRYCTMYLASITSLGMTPRCPPLELAFGSNRPPMGEREKIFS